MMGKEDCNSILIKIAVLEERVDNLERYLKKDFGTRIEKRLERISDRVENRFKWIQTLFIILLTTMVGAIGAIYVVIT